MTHTWYDESGEWRPAGQSGGGMVYFAPPHTPPPSQSLLDLLSMNRQLSLYAPHLGRGDYQTLRLGGPHYELLYRVNERAQGRGKDLGRPINWKGL